MSKSVLVIGVKSIKRGPMPTTGLMGTVLTSLGNTYKDSASFKGEKSSVFNVEVEESDYPEGSISTKGAKKLVFSLVDHSAETKVAVLGGSISNGVYSDPLTAPVIEECYQVISKTGFLYEIPRGSVNANENDELAKGKVGTIDVEVTPLLPFGAVAPVMTSVYQNPTVAITSSATPVLASAPLVATASAYRGVIKTQNWAILTKPEGAPAPTIAAPTSLSTTISGLQNGVYTGAITVRDENDFETVKPFTLTVTIP